MTDGYRDRVDTAPSTDTAASLGPAPPTPNPAVASIATGGRDADLPWRRLAPGMLLVEPVRELIRFIPMLVILLFAGTVRDSGPPWGLIATAAVIILGISRYATTRYRITPTVVEVRRGVFQRKHLTVPRDRVRTVDISAHPLQRVLHLVKLRIGTGTSHHAAEGLALDGLPVAVAQPLRAELLHHGRVPNAAGTTGTTAGEGATDPGGIAAPPQPALDQAADETELARLNPRWIRFAPATLSGVITAAFLIGLAWRLINEASVDPTQFDVVRTAVRYLQTSPLWLDVVQGAVAIIVVVTALSLAGYVVAFWGYRLARHTGGSLQVSRGLLTTRATSIEERRLYGVERVEPLLLRSVGGARLGAIATGLRDRGGDRGGSLLVPPAPVATVIALEAEVLGSTGPDGAGAVPLTPHGPAARRRRHTRAFAVTAMLLAVFLGLSAWMGWLPAAFLAAPVALVVTGWLAHDRYRSLGHALVAATPTDRGRGGPRLVVRTGSVVRKRVVLAVPGVIGVTLRQSFFQRRNDLVSLTATTAAGEQHYVVPDLPTSMAADLLPVLVPESEALMPGR
jgi:putative membrane protein